MRLAPRRGEGCGQARLTVIFACERMTSPSNCSLNLRSSALSPALPSSDESASDGLVFVFVDEDASAFLSESRSTTGSGMLCSEYGSWRALSSRRRSAAASAASS